MLPYIFCTTSNCILDVFDCRAMSEQQFTVKIPERNEDKKYYVMKFNSNLGVDVAKWNQVCIKSVTHFLSHHRF